MSMSTKSLTTNRKRLAASALVAGIAVTGLAMKFVMHTDVVAVKTFFLGLMVFEINPLPGLNPDYSDLVILARQMGIEYETLIKSIVQTALKRCQKV